MLDVSSWSTELEERGAEMDVSWESSTDREEKQLIKSGLRRQGKVVKFPRRMRVAQLRYNMGKHVCGGVVIGVKNEVASVVDTTGSKVESFHDKRRNEQLHTCR